MDTNNNENLNNVPDTSNVQVVPHAVNPTVQEKPSDQSAILSLVLGIIGSILSIGIGVFFFLMFAFIIGFVLISQPSYIIICSVVALIGTALGITSIVLGAKSVKYYPIISIFGIISGLAATSAGIFDLYVFWLNANF